MPYVKKTYGFKRSAGFTLFEMVVVICSIVILYMVAERRLNELPAAAERASFYAIFNQIKIGVNFEMYTRLARGGIASVQNLEGTNPMHLLLEPPNNYWGELEEVTDTNIDRRRSWYFETSTNELVYVVGGPSIDDVFVSFGNVEVNFGQIRFKLENVYKPETNTDGQGGKWEALLLREVRPYRWEARPEQPIEI